MKGGKSEGRKGLKKGKIKENGRRAERKRKMEEEMEEREGRRRGNKTEEWNGRKEERGTKGSFDRGERKVEEGKARNRRGREGKHTTQASAQPIHQVT